MNRNRYGNRQEFCQPEVLGCKESGHATANRKHSDHRIVHHEWHADPTAGLPNSFDGPPAALLLDIQKESAFSLNDDALHKWIFVDFDVQIYVR
jgi:hypothetical protein